VLSYSSSLSIRGHPGKIAQLTPPPLSSNHFPFHGLGQAWRLAIVAFRCGCCRARFTTFEALYVRYNQAKALGMLKINQFIELITNKLILSLPTKPQWSDRYHRGSTTRKHHKRCSSNLLNGLANLPPNLTSVPGGLTALPQRPIVPRIEN
jgi:hypothetical protein